MHSKLHAVFALALAVALGAWGCASPQPAPAPAPEPEVPETDTDSSATLILEDYPVIEDTDFGGVYIGITIDDFNDLGFSFGDSVSVFFSNGVEIMSIPYYSGYYVASGDPLLVAYPGYPYIKVCYNNGDPLWEVGGFEEGDTASIVLDEPGVYSSVQEAFDMTYEDERSAFESDEQFANFRALSGGNLVEGLFFRSASPVDDEHNRAGYANQLIEGAGVRFILDLSDNDDEIAAFRADAGSKGTDISYFESLLAEGNVMGIDLASNFSAQIYREKLAGGLIELEQHEGPYLLHCVEGKDRTGFACVVLEALAGASYDELLDDYMITYANYYGITEQSKPDQYHAVADLRLSEMLVLLAGVEEDADLTQIDYYEPARNYLRSGGMTDEQIDLLVAILTGEGAQMDAAA